MPQCNVCDSILDLSRRLRAPEGSAPEGEKMGMAATCPACRAFLDFGCCTPEGFRQIKGELAAGAAGSVGAACG